MDEQTEFTNIYVKNLDPAFDDDQLEQIFGIYGDIISHRIPKDEYDQSKGYAYIEYATPYQAGCAISAANGRYLDGNKLIVEKFIPKKERVQLMENNFTNIYVKNFGPEFTDAKLKNLFKRFGSIISCKVETDENNRSKGYGYVSFSEHNSAANAVKEMNGKQMRDKKMLYVSPFKSKAQRQNEVNHCRQRNYSESETSNLYVKNLDSSVDDDRLRKMFLPFGNITSAKVFTKNGVSKNFGFVCFEDRESAEHALAEMNGKIIASKELYVNWPEKKETRKARLSSEFQMKSARAKLPNEHQCYASCCNSNSSVFPIQQGMQMLAIQGFPLLYPTGPISKTGGHGKRSK